MSGYLENPDLPYNDLLILGVERKEPFIGMSFSSEVLLPLLLPNGLPSIFEYFLRDDLNLFGLPCTPYVGDYIKPP